ncbi:YjgN family protein [Citrobacter amalonaticus]|uniref:YjgN family protein n=1 Tax=Citrobacter amalonaticus TaxID=35703 RepID=UPI00300DB571
MQEDLIKEDAPSHAFEFRGDGGSYFLICLVNSLLVLVTLGIYLPWALMKCRRYIYSNMTLNGQPFTWKVTGGDVFLSWLMLLVIYIAGMVLISMEYFFIGGAALAALILSIPVLVMKNLQYQAVRTSLNSIHFGFRFSALKAFWNILCLPVLLLIALGVVIFCLLQVCTTETPGGVIFTVLLLGLTGLVGAGVVSGVTYSRLMMMVGEGGRFGLHPFSVQVNVWHCIKSAILAMAALVPFLAVVGFIAIALFTSISGLDVSGMTEDEIESLILIEYQRQIVISQIIYYLGIAISMSYLIVAFRNHFLNNLQLADGHIRFRSTLTWHGMVYRLGGLYVISAITGGLAYPLLRVWLISWLAKNTFVVGDLDTLTLADSDEPVDNGVVSRLSRGVMPTLYFM